MKLKDLRIRNFRCYRVEFSVSFEAMTCLIARNDIGKSTVLEALEAFFNLDKLDAEDRSAGVPANQPIEITCVFDDLQSDIVVDTDSVISAPSEYLLNAHGRLEITKRFSGTTPKCEEIFVRAVHPTANQYGDLFGLTIAGLRQRSIELGINLAGVNQTIKSALRHAIWASMNVDRLLLQEIQLEIRSTIWKPLQNALPLYQLFRADRPSSDQDAEAQDPIKFAVREALASQELELEAIGTRVKQRVEAVTRATVSKIKELDPDLARELNPVFSSFNWSKVFSVSLTGEAAVPLNKRGSGVRRLFLISFFRARAEQLAEERGAPDVILAIEEPETSQHPNNQIVLLDALRELSLSKSTQIVITTHNPLLARKIDQSHLRFIEMMPDGTRAVAAMEDASFTRMKNSLGILPNHNVSVFVGVEGPNDIEFLKIVSAILSQTEADIPDLAQGEQQGRVVFIPMGGSTLETWANRLAGLNLPEIHVIDRDTQPPQPAKYQAFADLVNARGGGCEAHITSCKEMENFLHPDAIQESLQIAVGQIAAFEDVPTRVAELVHAASGSAVTWENLSQEKREKKVSNAKRRLNRESSKQMNPIRLSQADPADEVRGWLRRIGIHLQN
jgi:putative ATP-dependent endonuclease of OLD family